MWKCHDEDCTHSGNLAYLTYGWLNHEHPAGGRLRGEQFKQVRDFLREVFRSQPPDEPDAEPKPAKPKRPRKKATQNLPLAETTAAGTRALVDPPLSISVIEDREDMTRAARLYLNERPFLTPDTCIRWQLGYLPPDESDPRAKSLQGTIIWPFQSEEGHLLAYISRDLKYEDKLDHWHLTNRRNQQPVRHRFLPRAFNPNLELFGQQVRRFNEHDNAQIMHAMGVLVVQDYMNVIALDQFGIPSVGICSEEITKQQVDKIERLARQRGSAQVKIMMNCDRVGDQLAKELLWACSCRHLDVQLLWSTRKSLATTTRASLSTNGAHTMDRRNFLTASAALAVTPSLTPLLSSDKQAEQPTSDSCAPNDTITIRCCDLPRWNIFASYDAAECLIGSKEAIDQFRSRIRILRRSLRKKQGIRLPTIRIRDDKKLPSGRIDFAVGHCRCDHLQIRPDATIIVRTHKVTDPLQDHEDLNWLTQDKFIGWAKGEPLQQAVLPKYRTFPPVYFVELKLDYLARDIHAIEVDPAQFTE